MGEHRPTIVNDPDQDGESLDADLLPDEFPDDRPLASRSYGTTEAEQARGESLSRKLRREEPDVTIDDHDNGSGDEDDSPDILSRDRDTDDGELLSLRARVDRHADDSGQPRGTRSAEEDAIHVVDGDTDLDIVTVSELTLDDAEDFIDAVQASRELHRRWVDPPDDLAGFKELLDKPEDRHKRYAIRCDEGLVGMVNANEIVMGRFKSAYLGYYAFAGFERRGLMRAGMHIALSELFDTIGLHRVEANIQPENERSIRLVERLGFRREGYSPAYLFIDGAWRDHERWALLSSDPR